jgi:hypothetical protein
MLRFSLLNERRCNTWFCSLTGLSFVDAEQRKCCVVQAVFKPSSLHLCKTPKTSEAICSKTVLVRNECN